MNQPFEGRFIEAADMMQSSPLALIISSHTEANKEKAADGRVIDKEIIGFEGTDKRLILGRTNTRNIKAEFGSDRADWIGKKVVLAVRYLKRAFGQSNVPCIRVIPQNVPLPYASYRHMGGPEPWSEDQLK